jgi:chromosome segregation ATPase
MSSFAVTWRMPENGTRQWVTDSNLIRLLIVVVLALVGQIYLNINSTTEQTARDVGQMRETLTGLSKDVGHLTEDDTDLKSRMARIEGVAQGNTDKTLELQRRLDNQKINRAETQIRHARVQIKAAKLARKHDLDDFRHQLDAAKTTYATAPNKVETVAVPVKAVDP